MKRRSSLAYAGVLLACACSQEPRPKAEPAPEAPAPAAPAPSAAAEAKEPTPDEVPVAEDFEAEAAQQITDDNFKAELDALEKEMNAEK
jgi:hypothetical protein